MNPFPEPTPYQRHEWNTFMCLLWHITHVPLPSEPSPYQTPTTHPRSALQLALRYVRATECIYEVIQAVCDWPVGWGQDAGLFEIYSWQWHRCWLSPVTHGEATGWLPGPNENGIAVSSVYCPGSQADYSWQWRWRALVNYRPASCFPYISRRESEWTHVSCHWGRTGLNGRGKGWLSSMFRRRLYREFTWTAAPEGSRQLVRSVTWYLLSLHRPPPLPVSFATCQLFLLLFALPLLASLPTYLSLRFNCLAPDLFVFL